MSYPVHVTGLAGLWLNFDCSSLIFFLAYKEPTGDMNIAFFSSDVDGGINWCRVF